MNMIKQVALFFFCLLGQRQIKKEFAGKCYHFRTQGQFCTCVGKLQTSFDLCRINNLNDLMQKRIRLLKKGKKQQIKY